MKIDISKVLTKINERASITFGNHLSPIKISSALWLRDGEPITYDMSYNETVKFKEMSICDESLRFFLKSGVAMLLSCTKSSSQDLEQIAIVAGFYRAAMLLGGSMSQKTNTLQ